MDLGVDESFIDGWRFNGYNTIRHLCGKFVRIKSIAMTTESTAEHGRREPIETFRVFFADGSVRDSACGGDARHAARGGHCLIQAEIGVFPALGLLRSITHYLHRTTKQRLDKSRQLAGSPRSV